MRPASLSMSYFQLLVRRFGETPVLRAAILEGTGVAEADLEDAGAEISLAQQVRQIDNMNRVLGEGWALTAPELWRPSSHGPLGVAATSAASVEEALAVLARYARTRSLSHRFRLVREADALVLEHRVAADLLPAQRRTFVETFFLSIRAILQALLGQAPDDVRYQFAVPEPHHAARVREVLGGEVAYDAPRSAVTVPARYLKARSPLADPALHRYACEQMDLKLRETGAPLGVRARVERLLARSGAGRLPAAAAAETLGLSSRTLVRRLAEAGISYRELVDAELKARARGHLEAGVLSHAEIADRLGFADATGFSRACRRWFRGDQSP